MSKTNSTIFNPDCRDCPRLARFLDQTAEKYPAYHARPVAPFGDRKARLLIVGLAPGMHGANATGRPFTGDYAGDVLYPALSRYGFAKGTFGADPNDGLTLIDCRITNAVRCVPPQNKPNAGEINTCRRYLVDEIDVSPRPQVRGRRREEPTTPSWAPSTPRPRTRGCRRSGSTV